MDLFWVLESQAAIRHVKHFWLLYNLGVNHGRLHGPDLYYSERIRKVIIARSGAERRGAAFS